MPILLRSSADDETERTPVTDVAGEHRELVPRHEVYPEVYDYECDPIWSPVIGVAGEQGIPISKKGGQKKVSSFHRPSNSGEMDGRYELPQDIHLRVSTDIYWHADENHNALGDKIKIVYTTDLVKDPESNPLAVYTTRHTVHYQAGRFHWEAPR